MKVVFNSKGGFDNALSWLSRISQRSPTNALRRIGEDGVRNLSTNTPKDTGATAAGWKYKIERDKQFSQVSWYNDAHPEISVNPAKLIELGHGTGTGGYVPPRPYIKQSMDPVFNNVGDQLAREMIK